MNYGVIDTTLFENLQALKMNPISNDKVANWIKNQTKLQLDSGTLDRYKRNLKNTIHSKQRNHSARRATVNQNYLQQAVGSQALEDEHHQKLFACTFP